MTHALAKFLEQLDRGPAEFKEQVAGFLDGLVSLYVLDDGQMVVEDAVLI